MNTEYQNSHDIENDKAALDVLQKTIDDIEKIRNEEKDISEILPEEVKESVPIEEEPNIQDSPEEVENKQETTEVEEDLNQEEKDRLWKHRKQQYKNFYEKQALKEENAKLRELVNEALNSGQYHYGKSANAELEKAIQAKEQAIITGDVKALIKADLELNRISHDINKIQEWESRAAVNPNYASPAQQPAHINQTTNNEQEVHQELIRDWIADHTYLQPESPDYNQELHTKVWNYAKNLDANLANQGRKDLYFTPEYFHEIDKYVASVRRTPQKIVPKDISAISHVGGVRNSGHSPDAKKGTTKVTLTADEKRLAYNLGVPEGAFLKTKIELSMKEKVGRL